VEGEGSLGKRPAASGGGGGGTAGPPVDGDIESEDSGFGDDDGFLIIEPRQAEFILEEGFGSWKEKAEKRLERMKSQTTELFQYSSVSPACVAGGVAASDANTSCATIRLEERTTLQFPRPKKKFDRKNLLSIVELLRTALGTKDANLDAKVVEYEGWTGSIVILISASLAVLSRLYLRIRTPQDILFDDGQVQLTVTELAPLFFWKILDIDYSLAMQHLLNRRLSARKRDLGVAGQDVGGAWFEIKPLHASFEQQQRGILVLAKNRVTAQQKALPDLSGDMDVQHKCDTVSLAPSGSIRGASGCGSSSAREFGVAAVPSLRDNLRLLPTGVGIASDIGLAAAIGGAPSEEAHHAEIEQLENDRERSSPAVRGVIAGSGPQRRRLDGPPLDPIPLGRGAIHMSLYLGHGGACESCRHR
jgi:hypothetical protein